MYSIIIWCHVLNVSCFSKFKTHLYSTCLNYHTTETTPFCRQSACACYRICIYLCFTWNSAYFMTAVFATLYGFCSKLQQAKVIKIMQTRSINYVWWRNWGRNSVRGVFKFRNACAVNFTYYTPWFMNTRAITLFFM